jgi:hypothetical protein
VSGEEHSVASGPITDAELWDFASDWYRKLDVHVPVGEILPGLADAELEMRFPEATERGHAGFTNWYERVTRIFFDEIHTLKTAQIVEAGEQPTAKVIVNWQAKVWNPPDARSKWLGFDAFQTWVLRRAPGDGHLQVVTYIVDSLAPMPGSATL